MPAIPDKSLATNTHHASRIRHLPTKEKVSNLGGARGWIGLFGAAPTFTKYVSLVALPHILRGVKTTQLPEEASEFPTYNFTTQVDIARLMSLISSSILTRTRNPTHLPATSTRIPIVIIIRIAVGKS